MASTWSEVYNLTQNYLMHVENLQDKVVRIFGYGSLIFNNVNEKQGSLLENEPAILNGAKVSLNLMAAGEGEYRGEYNQFNDGRSRKSVGVYMGMEQGEQSDFAQGLNVTLEIERAKDSLKLLFERELGKLPYGINFDDLLEKNNNEKFSNIPEEQNKLKLYKLAIVETIVKDENEKDKSTLALVVPSNEKSALSAVGRGALEVAVMAAQGQGISRKKGESTVGGDAIDYFRANLENFRKNNIKVPFMEKVNEALEVYLKFCNDINSSIKSGSLTANEFANLYEKNNLTQFSQTVKDPSLPKGEYINSGITSPFFNKNDIGETTQRTDFTLEEYSKGLENIPFTAKLSIERLASLHDKYFGEKAIG